jgi:hypothetical protein
MTLRKELNGQRLEKRLSRVRVGLSVEVKLLKRCWLLRVSLGGVRSRSVFEQRFRLWSFTDTADHDTEAPSIPAVRGR